MRENPRKPCIGETENEAKLGCRNRKRRRNDIDGVDADSHQEVREGSAGCWGIPGGQLR